MKDAIEYTDAPADVEYALAGKVRVLDFLPPPEQLVERVEKEKITILLNKHSVDFFRTAAEKEGVKYQTMINNLLDTYVRRYG
ncbi:MAG: BrnA antitoxin family protein [Coriobacteriales bacterium]|nr:BrnA antitoxin family protein [Coriobacteriales bacterium]